jgi:hypothetical protein
LSPAGCLLAVIGAANLARRNQTALLLLALIGTAAFVFAWTFAVPDVEVFVIPTFLTLWLLAAVGLGAIERLPTGRPWLGRLAAASITAGLVAMLTWRAYAQEDLSRETYDIQYFDAFFQRVHFPGNFLMDEDQEYETQQALRYKLYAEHAARGAFHAGDLDELPDPRVLLTMGREVYAFEPARAYLEGRGLLFAPVALSTFDMSRRPLFRAVGTLPCRDVRSGEWAIFEAGELLGPRITMWIHSGALGPGLGTARVTVWAQTAERPLDAATRLVEGRPLEDRGDAFRADVLAELKALTTQLAKEALQVAVVQPFIGRDQLTLPLTGPRGGAAVLAVSPLPKWLAARFEAQGGAMGRFCASPVNGTGMAPQ